MKKAEFYQCEWCCFTGVKEQVEEHEKHCLAKRDLKKDLPKPDMCFTCKHFYKMSYSDKKVWYCMKNNDLIKSIPYPQECQDYELDAEWVAEAERVIRLNTAAVMKYPNRVAPEIFVPEFHESTNKKRK